MKCKIRLFDLFFYSVLLIFLVALGLMSFPFLEKRISYPLKYSEFVDKYSEEFDVDNLFCYSLMKAESNFNKKAVSKSNAYGLMQITLPTGVFIAEKLDEIIDENQLKNPETNIKYGVFYISYLSKKYSDYTEILAAYNAGEGRVNEWLKDTKYSSDGLHLNTTPYTETNIYIKKTLKYYNKYKIYYNT